MVKAKEGIAKNGKVLHYSVGALIYKKGKYLLIDRTIEPFGFASVAGHIDEGESPVEALVREVEEEINLKVENKKLLDEEELDWNWCSKGVEVHHWYIFECEVAGKVKRSKRETKSAGWYTRDEIKELKLEPSWEYWFKKLKII